MVSQKFNMNPNAEPSTEELIKKTAREVFMQKGLDGARMQDIADKAGINKALLHYYFRSKEKLFEIIYKEQRQKFQEYLSAVIESDLNILEKVEKVVEKQIDNLIADPQLPRFIMGEVMKRPELVETHLPDSQFVELIQKFVKEINREVKNGTIKNTSGEQLVIHIFSLDVFPFLSMTLFKRVLNLDDNQYMKLMQKRKKEVSSFIINAIKP